jgi:hypothetical protein
MDEMQQDMEDQSQEVVGSLWWHLFTHIFPIPLGQNKESFHAKFILMVTKS